LTIDVWNLFRRGGLYMHFAMAQPRTDIIQVLLAEDNPDDSMLFTLAADVSGHILNVSLAENGDMLLNFLQHNMRPSIIFLDLDLPIKTGKDCLKTIRSNHDLDSIPIVVYSGSSSTNDIDECFNSGANYFVVKPANFEGIIRMFQKVFEIDFKVPRARDKFLFRG
jgi:CheY-like chemotaxis protein